MTRLVIFVGLLLSPFLVQAGALRIGVSETLLSLPLYVAEEEGYFQQQGVSVEFVNCVGGNRCMKHMLEGQVDLSTATELPVVFNSFARSDFAVQTSFVSSSNDMKVVARADSNVSQPDQLRNKTLGYVRGSASQYVLDSVLVYNGIDPDTTNLKLVTPESALRALVDKEVDALCIWEPFASLIELQLGSEVTLVPIPKLYTTTFNLIAMKSVIANKPEELQRLIRALRDSTEFIQANPEKAKATAARRLRVPVVLIEKIFNDYRFRLSLNRSLPRTMEGQARWAMREGYVDGHLSQPNYTGFFSPDFLKAVSPGAVSFQ